MPYGMRHDISGNRKKLDALGELVLRRRGYLCLGQLGKGAFSRVCLVERGDGGRVCACKISENARILEKEARVMALLEHSLFPEYIDSFREAGLGFLFSEYVAGCSMEEMLGRRGHFTPAQTVRAGIALAEGLRHLHERRERFLFRDVKPSNIMIRQDGKIKLIDLGCACSLEAGVCSRAGTPGFAAPEQLSGEERLTAACDVYGLGRTLEAMLGDAGGRKGKKGSSKTDREEQRRYVRLARILKACTQDAASKRIQDMGGLLCRLKPLEEENKVLK